MKLNIKAICGPVLLVLVIGAFFGVNAATSKYRGEAYTSPYRFTSRLEIAGLVNVAEAETLRVGNLTINVSSASSIIVLNSNANITGVTLVGGVENQIVELVTGTGANTIRLDDNGASLALGANITLTEGQYDVLTVRCYDEDNQFWRAVSAHDN